MYLNRQAGFSLLEVLVAFSVLAVSLGILFQIYSKGAYSARLSNDYTNAVIIAQSELAIIGIESIPDVGVYENSDDKYHWIIRIKPMEEYGWEQDLNLFKREIEIEISWQNRGDTRSVRLNTIKLFPAT